MEAPKWPETESPQTKITLLKEVLGDGPDVYRFFEDGQPSPMGITRERPDDDVDCYVYHLQFYGWEFAHTEVHLTSSVTEIEWQGIGDGLTGMGAVQAQKLLKGSEEFVMMALHTDFPDTVIEDISDIEI